MDFTIATSVFLCDSCTRNVPAAVVAMVIMFAGFLRLCFFTSFLLLRRVAPLDFFRNDQSVMIALTVMFQNVNSEETRCVM